MGTIWLRIEAQFGKRLFMLLVNKNKQLQKLYLLLMSYNLKLLYIN